MTYTCPMHPEVQQHKPGTCPKCHMALVSGPVEVEKSSYKPLLIIVSLITLASLVASDGNTFMMNFMAGFFLVFSGFKLLDLKGFVDGYRTYDLLAKKVPAYGYVFPFIELGLGLAYLSHNVTTPLLIFTAALMTFSGIGVAVALLGKKQFHCACLGTLLKVPLTKVALVENFGMALMAVIMLVSMQAQPIAPMDHAMEQPQTEKEFVIMMIPHHQDAIDMANHVLMLDIRPEIRQLAQDIIVAQQAEIEMLEEWLATKYDE